MVTYRTDMHDSRLRFFQDDLFLERKSPCCNSYSQVAPFHPDKNLLKTRWLLFKFWLRTSISYVVVIIIIIIIVIINLYI